MDNRPEISQEETNHEFEALLNYLKATRGFDFASYKRPSLMRRVLKRVQVVGADSYAGYLDYLQVHPDEFMELFNTILINVTSFFRDEVAWDYLKEEIMPKVIAEKRSDELIRVWSAGCASGEEACTVAMALTEILGEQQFQDRVKIYATDADDDALTTARAASYSPKQVETLPQHLLDKYFERSDSRYLFRKELRRNIIYGRHDLLQDAPISRVDLLLCRNTLMYFNAEAQARILVHFHFALNESGYLFLGKSEMLLTHSNLFTPVDLKRRVFQKVAKINLRDRLMILAQTGQEDAAGQLANHIRIREASFDAGPIAQIVIDVSGFLLLANHQARAVFGISHRDVGRLFQDLEISYRPVELRSLIEQAYAERRLVSQKEVAWQISNTEARYLDIDVMPLISNNGTLGGVSVTFTDVTRYKRLESELQRSKHELETAYEELQSTVEELETTNEELQSTNEELETLNEELQSTNEELETMNEEQQSTNEELEAINEELRQRTNELDHVNRFLASILSSVRMGVVVLDREMRIEIWNNKAEDLWGLRQEEVQGKHLLNLDFGLNVEELKQPLRTLLSGEEEYAEAILKATNRRGRPFDCRIVFVKHDGMGKDNRGAIMMMEEIDISLLSGNDKEHKP